MSHTLRKSKTQRTTYHLDKDVSPFYCRHDSTEDRVELNRSFRREEKQYFMRFCVVKYNQQPKSRGWKTW